VAGNQGIGVTSHAVVVLAAGGSSRLGASKQLLKRDGETLVHRAVRLARATSPSRLIVVVGAEGPAIIDALADLDPTVVHNARWQEGLASSLHAAGESIAGFDGPVLVLGCDQPALEGHHLDDLLAGAAHASAHASATLHEDAAGIPAVVPAAWFRDVLTRGDLGFGTALRDLPRGSLHLLDAPALHFDIDTPADAEAAVARGWLDRATVSPHR
jgi:molybdenum cofactor cytidylyltransferase